MEMISLDRKTNFFENKVSEYALANKTIDDSIFDMTADFYRKAFKIQIKTYQVYI